MYLNNSRWTIIIGLARHLHRKLVDNGCCWTISRRTPSPPVVSKKASPAGGFFAFYWTEEGGIRRVARTRATLSESTNFGRYAAGRLRRPASVCDAKPSVCDAKPSVCNAQHLQRKAQHLQRREPSLPRGGFLLTTGRNRRVGVQANPDAAVSARHFRAAGPLRGSTSNMLQACAGAAAATWPTVSPPSLRQMSSVRR